MKKMMLLSYLNILILIPLPILLAATGNFYFLWGVPVMWAIAIYLHLKRCPRCKHRWTKRINPKGFQAKRFYIAPIYCPQCGYPSNNVKDREKDNKWYEFAKAALVIFGGICISIIILIVNKHSRFEEATRTVDEFHKCWTPKGYQNCQYASYGMRATPSDTIVTNGTRITKNLGTRLSGEIIKEEFKSYRPTSLKGKDTSDILGVKVLAVYKNDKTVLESYRLIYDKNVGHYQVDFFQLSSTLLK